MWISCQQLITWTEQKNKKKKKRSSAYVCMKTNKSFYIWKMLCLNCWNSVLSSELLFFTAKPCSSQIYLKFHVVWRERAQQHHLSLDRAYRTANTAVSQRSLSQGKAPVTLSDNTPLLHTVLMKHCNCTEIKDLCFFQPCCTHGNRLLPSIFSLKVWKRNLYNTNYKLYRM